MLDVMKNPPPVIEQITWKAARVEMPDDGTTVLIYNAADEEDPVWLGWWDSGADTWMTAEGFPLSMVTWWADVPAGPSEPKPGQGNPLIAQAVMEQVVSTVYGSDGMPSQLKKHHLQWVVRTLLRQLGLATLGGRQLVIDLDNGHSLQVTVSENQAPETAAPNATSTTSRATTENPA